MVFRRGKRPSWYFSGRTRTGWQQLCAYTPDKRLGEKIEGMWEELAARHRAWDILYRVIAGEMTPADLYDVWLEARRNVEELRRRLNDRDIEPLVSEWHEGRKRMVSEDSAAHSLAHVRWLVEEGTPLLGSKVTPHWLTKRLAAYPGKRNTLRKVHSSWSGFFRYCTKVAGVFTQNPMDDVARPDEEKSPIRFYELDVVEQIVDWQPTAQRQALMALAYGAALEVSVILTLTRDDFNPATKEVRAAGTKTHTRDRVARIADWAWPTVWAYVGGLEPNAKLFPGVTRWGAGFWHRQTVKQGIKKAAGRKQEETGGHAVIVKQPLTVPAKYTLHNARDHWAVQMLRSGAPVAVVQQQLGHASPVETLEKYGRFLPSVADREQWERRRSEYEETRRKSLESKPVNARDSARREDSEDATS